MTLKAMQLTKFKRLLAKFYRARGLFCLLFIFTSPVHASGKFAPWPSDLGADIPAPWQAQYHPKIAAHTEFKLIKQGKKTLLQADANMAYGTLVHPFPMPTELKKLHWEWQVLIHPSNANLQTKAGDDAGAKLCVFVQIDEAKLGLGTRLALATARTNPVLCVGCAWWKNRAGV